MKKCLPILIVVMLCAGGTRAFAGTADEESAVREVLQHYGEAFTKGQAPSVGPAFTENALYITAGGAQVAGRETIQKRLADYLSTHKGDKMRLTAQQIRFVTPQVAQVQGDIEIRGPGGPPDFGRYSALLVKKSGRWMIDTLRDLPPPTPSETVVAANRLRELAWMVGEWRHSEGDNSVSLNCRYNAASTFLLWDYTIKQAGKELMTVQQRVGWDPQSQTLRSWVFDSVGGFAEGKWSADAGGAWEIQQSGVVPDGSGAAATCLVIPVDDNSFRYRMTDRRLNGSRMADAEMRFNRVPAGK